MAIASGLRQPHGQPSGGARGDGASPVLRTRGTEIRGAAGTVGDKQGKTQGKMVKSEVQLWFYHGLSIVCRSSLSDWILLRDVVLFYQHPSFLVDKVFCVCFSDESV